jgi:DNA polymerase (family 10)
MQYGVYQARRGWLEPQDVLNTRSWDELRELLAR